MLPSDLRARTAPARTAAERRGSRLGRWFVLLTESSHSCQPRFVGAGAAVSWLPGRFGRPAELATTNPIHPPPVGILFRICSDLLWGPTGKKLKQPCSQGNSQLPDPHSAGIRGARPRRWRKLLFPRRSVPACLPTEEDLFSVVDVPHSPVEFFSPDVRASPVGCEAC